MLTQILTLLGALAMFLYGMNMMSTGIQKAAGNKLRALLGAMTSKPLKGVLTGFGITAIIQSSSATTVLVVSFVSAGLLSLKQAIGVIMGANIGTTVTAWIISLLGFKFDIAVLSIPLFLLGFILLQLKKDKYHNIGEFIIGFSLLFLGLSLIKSSVPDLKSSPEVLSFIANWTNWGFWSILIFVLIGTILTLVLQSSSATMAITLIMLNEGWIPFEMGAAMVLGENIGTTITANIAAAMGNINAKRTALTHTVFNVFGVVWALALFKPFLALDRAVTGLIGEFNPLLGLSMFHTLFNTINTLLLIWFVPQLEQLVTKILPDKKANSHKLEEHLVYISGGPVATPELGAKMALMETSHFAIISSKEVQIIKDALSNLTSSDFEQHREKLVKYEQISDNIEKEVTNFLGNLTEEEVSANTAKLIKDLYRINSELESLGDSGECISRILQRIKQLGGELSPERKIGLSSMLSALENAYQTMTSNLKAIEESSDSKQFSISRALDDEIAINKLRDRLRDEEYSRIEHSKLTEEEYSFSTLYLDAVAELERMGDYLINISQAIDPEALAAA
ncbi:MAG: Na/Pi cotransporter family protein [Candidatus Cryptobacteroides sp.]